MKKIIIKGEDLARIPLWKTLGKPKDDEEIVLYQLEDGESFPVDKPVKPEIAECISPDGKLLIAIFEDGTSRPLTKEEWFTAVCDIRPKIKDILEFKKQ